MELPKLLCAKEVATMLGVSERTAARLMREGEVKAFKLSDSRWRTSARYVYEYVLRRMEEREGNYARDNAA